MFLGRSGHSGLSVARHQASGRPIRGHSCHHHFIRYQPSLGGYALSLLILLLSALIGTKISIELSILYFGVMIRADGPYYPLRGLPASPHSQDQNLIWIFKFMAVDLVIKFACSTIMNQISCVLQRLFVSLRILGESFNTHPNYATFYLIRSFFPALYAMYQWEPASATAAVT